MSWRSEADRVGRDCTRRNQALLFSSSFSGKAEKLEPPEECQGYQVLKCPVHISRF